MLLIGMILGLLTGLLVGGRLDNLIEVRLRWVWLIFLAVFVRFGTEFALRREIELAETLRLPLLMLAFGVLIGGLWLNRHLPGLVVAAAGATSNAFAIAVNGGFMPVWGPSVELAGLSSTDLSGSFHRLLPTELGIDFLLQAGPFGDILPIAVPLLTNVASVGDVFISAGLGWFVFSTLVRLKPPVLASAQLAGAAPGGDTLTLDRPMLLGGAPAAPSMPMPLELPGPDQPAAPRRTFGARVRGHPYIRLALDARFSAFWLGQTISLFGDRLHQVALGVLVYGATGSPLLTGLVFLAATLPNLLLGPIAGTFVDRWDHKHVMVVSDVLRAGLVLALPVAATNNLALIYPLVFLITTVSLFFRPARAAVVPRIVRREDLMAANSATWTGETLADIAGYPLAGLFVAFLGSALPIAFWVDSATYLVSALLLATLAIPPVVRATGSVVASGRVRAFFGELREGWRFLRGQPALFQNTLVSAVAQTSVGATLALTVVYARETLDGTLIGYPENYAAIEAAIGLGNLIGGLTVGAIGARLRKGPLIIGGFIAMGISTVLLGLTGNVALAMLAALAIGVANLVYIVPTQTLFAEITPMPMMGRVVAFRSSLVFGAMTGAMALASGMAEVIPVEQVGLVIAAFGALTAVTGMMAALLPAVRES